MNGREPGRTAGTASSGRRRNPFLDWRAILGIGISVVLLWLAFRGKDLGEVWREIRLADPLLFVAATAVATFVFWIRAWRWRSIIDPVRTGTSFEARFGAVAIGFMGNNLLPARIGEFARAYALSRTTRVPIVAAFSTLVIERLFDGIFVVAFLLVPLFLPGFPAVQIENSAAVTAARGLAVLVAAGFGVLTMLVIAPRRTVVLIEAVVERTVPRRLRRPLIDALEAFLSGLGILRDPRLLAQAAVWTLVLWFCNALGFWLAFEAFGLDLPFSAALFLQSVIALAVSVPSGPGFFGPWELAAQWVLSDLWGREATKALGFALGFHMAGFVPITLIGLFYVWRLGLSLRAVARTEQVVEEAVEASVGTGRPAVP